ncbi:hypothetical protein H6F75_13525 [Nodosilinea sp. FACHB-131]|uniref:hypothetical protein n=1 Tax=Cyanophyceae TaxID=3028117 RepID=UPI00168907D9|nr:hypothetical protein [Nodosilinea sp. FACHB-131]MBD1874507.1 hypothetical protein [Nodosilinea sp. FACHB-131]
MVNIIPPQTILTPAGAAEELQAEGLDALGLTVPNLSPAWAEATPTTGDYDDTALTLTLTNVLAPFRGIRTYELTPSFWSDSSGAPLPGPIAVLKLHPEAARRLERLVAARYGNPAIRPVPVAMVLQGITPPASLPVPDWFLAGEQMLAGTATVSFHDGRGLPVDPIAVAAMALDLLTWRPALQLAAAGAPAVDQPGGLNGIATLANGIRCHVINPHGWGYQPTQPTGRLKVIDAGSSEIAQVPDGGLIDWQADQRLGRSDTDEAADEAKPLYWGWATNGELTREPLSPPAGGSLSRQFLRVMAVELDWHLLGNRSDSPVATIPPDDGTTPDFLLPTVRPAVPNFDYLADGMDVLGATAEIAAGFPAPSRAGVFALAVSPALDQSLAVPGGTGGIGRWPTFPPPNTNAALPANLDPIAVLTGTWRDGGDGPEADLDVILTLPANTLPEGTHLRIYPRRFLEIQAISGEQPSFVRADGGAALAVSGTPIQVLLTNPFNLEPAEAKPNSARLDIDLVLTSRTGQRRLFSVVSVTLTDPPAPWTSNLGTFGGLELLNQPAFTALFSAFSTRAVAPTPLFGIPRTFVPPSGDPANIADLARRLASETQPRQGPRLPTQARFETILALGTSPAVDAQLDWQAVLTGARWQWESRCSHPELGNPGNPAGPDVHATGIRADGRLAYDLALHALKRSQAIIPTAPDSPGWIVTAGGDNWNAPPADTIGTVAAAMLETIAPFTDTPELGLGFIPIPQPGDSVQNTVNQIANDLGLTPPTVTVGNEEEIRPRVQREIITAKFGQRDALWALRRALGQAREFIYIESPMFASTARSDGPPLAHEIDLVEVIRQGLQDNSRLKVILCLPRLPDFDSARANWVRTALAHRREAIETLTTQAQQRVAAFHPIGFPGRSAVLRSTTVIVDDIWCLVGTSHFRRRGMTFDGGVDVVSMDRSIAEGYSAGISRFRQELMAAKLGIDVPTVPDLASALWLRLQQPEAAFDAVVDLLRQGGLGRCTPIWVGPNDTTVIPQDADVADPDGVDEDGSNLLALLGQLLLEG